MQRFCLVVADAARARIYTVEPAEADRPERGISLAERADLINSERRLRPSEIMSDTRPGTDHSGTGRGFTYDDHRDDHARESERRFAGEISARAAEEVAAAHLDHVVLVASPRMLGALRHALPAAPNLRTAEIDEMALDLTRLTTPQLHDRLAGLGLVPERAR